MALDAYADWDRYEQVNVDLSDVTGMPGLGTADEFAERVAVTSGFSEARNWGGHSDPFIVAHTTEATTTAPVDALSFLAADSGFLNPEDSTADVPAARVIWETTTHSGSHRIVRQELRGAELVGCRFSVHHTPGSTEMTVTGRPVGDLRAFDPGPRPDASPDGAQAAAREHFGLERDQPVAVDWVVFPIDGRGVWALECKVPLTEEPVDVRAYLRADDHSLLVSYNVACAALHGEAAVYPVNPRRTPDLRNEALWDIGPEPPDQLRGAVVSVAPHSGEAFRNALRDCRLTPDDAGFDEVQAWFHLGRATTYFRHLVGSEFFGRPPFSPMPVTVRDARAAGNAFFKPDLGEVWLGDFGGKPAARSADVVFHEFGHAISDSICRLGRARKNTPARGMSEGFADYFAASALDDPRIGDYVAGKDEGARRLDRPGLSLAAVAGKSEHAQGEVWGAVLWGIRSRIGQSISDVLAAESLNHLGPQAGYEAGLAALLRSDRELFPAAEERGRHADVINAEYSARQ